MRREGGIPRLTNEEAAAIECAPARLAEPVLTGVLNTAVLKAFSINGLSGTQCDCAPSIGRQCGSHPTVLSRRQHTIAGALSLDLDRHQIPAGMGVRNPGMSTDRETWCQCDRSTGSPQIVRRVVEVGVRATSLVRSVYPYYRWFGAQGRMRISRPPAPDDAGIARRTCSYARSSTGPGRRSAFADAGFAIASSVRRSKADAHVAASGIRSVRSIDSSPVSVRYSRFVSEQYDRS